MATPAQGMGAAGLPAPSPPPGPGCPSPARPSRGQAVGRTPVRQEGAAARAGVQAARLQLPASAVAQAAAGCRIQRPREPPRQRDDARILRLAHRTASAPTHRHGPRPSCPHPACLPASPPLPLLRLQPPGRAGQARATPAAGMELGSSRRRCRRGWPAPGSRRAPGSWQAPWQLVSLPGTRDGAGNRRRCWLPASAPQVGSHHGAWQLCGTGAVGRGHPRVWMPMCTGMHALCPQQ